MKKSKVRIKKAKKQKPWEAVKMKMFQAPNIFPEELPREQRLEIIRNVGSEADKEFQEKYPQLINWFKTYDAPYLLTYIAQYLFSMEEGRDPEATGDLEYPHHLLEILQAFSLYEPRSKSIEPLKEKAKNLEEDIKRIHELMQRRLLKIPDKYTNIDDIEKYNLRVNVMAQTTAVRNWAYIDQMKTITIELANLVKSDFESIYKVDPVKVMTMLFSLAEERDDLINSHRQKLRKSLRKSNYKEMLRSYYKIFLSTKKLDDSDISDIWEKCGKKLSYLRGFLMSHADLLATDIYTFNIDHATNIYGDITAKGDIDNILKMLSYKFGDLKDFEMGHIILNNPIHKRPFILLNKDEYYSAIFGIIPHLALDILENLISNHASLADKYNLLKGKYLESKVEKLCEVNFPNAQIYPASLWSDPARPETIYENDLLIIIDSFALIIECKAGQITDPARRGAPDRLAKTMEELIEEPADQAHRFINYLKTERKIHTLKRKDGKQNIIDSTKLKYFIPIGVTLSTIWTISSNQKKLIDAGITNKSIEQLALSLSYTDLEIVFELLPLEAEKIHYLSRRREFEKHIDYEGDELDLLGFYLDNGFNIGDQEYKGELRIYMVLKSKELDPYFVGRYSGVPVKKPILAMTTWWKDLLETMATRKVSNWMENSFIILNVAKNDQEKFESMAKKLTKNIFEGKVKNPHNWVACFSGPEQRRYLIACYQYTTSDKTIRNNMIGHIIDEAEKKDKLRGCLVIGIDLNLSNISYPYSVLAGKLETDLFDSEFL